MGEENEDTTQEITNFDVKDPADAPSAPVDVTPDPSPDEPSMLDVAKKIAADHEEATDESDVSPEDATAPDEETAEGEDTPVEPQDEKLPFAKHKRFQELLSEAKSGKEFKAQVEPLLKDWQTHTSFLEKHGISNNEVATVMNALAWSKVDPAKAKEMLKPLYESLGQLDPNVLPTDLQDRVKEGDITEEMARRLWKAECGSKVAARSGEFTAKQQAQVNAQLVDNAITAWEQKARKQNPDFKPSTDAKRPGLLEATRAFYSHSLAAAIGGGQANTPTLHQQLLDQALADAKALFVSRERPAATRKLPNSRMSSGTQRLNKKTFDPDREIAAVARKYGYDFRRNGEDEE